MKKTTDNPILSVIESAQPVNKKGVIDRFADQRCDEFSIIGCTMIFWRRGRDNNEIYTPLTTNCALLIVEEHLLDDGVKQEIVFLIEGRQSTGQLLSPVTIPATQYSNMQWLIKHYGTRAAMEADQATPRRLATAIQKLSGNVPRTTIYQHTGWREIDKQWFYLSASGALGANGLNVGVRVDLGEGNLKLYELPEPPDNPGELVRSIFSLLEIAPNNPAVGVALFCGVVRAVLGECLPIDFSLFLSGTTGAQKSECAALGLAFFGRFTSRTLTAGWHDTESNLEISSHKIKDAMWNVDDFKNGVTQQENNKIYAKAERLFRSVGNQSARGRCNVDMTVKAAYFPRCMVFSTSEDIPKGASLLGRMLIVEIKKGDINLSYLTAMQHLAAKGELALIMSAFIKWLAPRINDLKRSFPLKVRDLRDKALQDKFASSHSRAADIYASLFASAAIFLGFAHEVGAINGIRANDLANSIDEALKNAILAQSAFQKQSDEAERFVSLLRSCFTSGDCHVSDHLKQGPPLSKPYTWGWRALNEGGELAAKGANIGWINELKNELWLDPEATFKAVQKFASAQNESILMQKSIIYQRLLERGVLIDSEPDKNSPSGRRPYPKRSVGGVGVKRIRVCVFSTTLITGGGDD